MSETSWFETGLMSCDSTYQGWKDAKWIGGSDQDMVLYSHYLPVFRLEYTIQLNEILKSKNLFNEAEIAHAIKYVEGLREKFMMGLIN